MMASIHDNFQHNSNELFKEGRKKADETRVTPVLSWCAAPVCIADLYVVVAVDIDIIGVVKFDGGFACGVGLPPQRLI